MTPIEERRLLESILKNIDRDPSSPLQSRWLPYVGWLAFAVLYLVAFRFWDSLHPLALALVFSSAGVVVGVLAMCRSVVRQWSVLRQHVDRNSMLARLEQMTR
jgi:hypothetical protein